MGNTITLQLELKSGTLGLLLAAQLEVLATLKRQLHLILANRALQSQHDFLSRLRLLVEDRLGLTTIS